VKLATIRTEEGAAVALVDRDAHPIPLSEAYSRAGLDPSSAPRTMLDLISGYATLEADLRRASAKTSGAEAPAFRWLPPVPNPSKILGCAINNSGLNDLAKSYAENPPFFVKLPSAMVGHEEPVVIRPDYGLTHPEGELVAVIGRHCKHLAPAEVAESIFGYTIIDDVTSITLKSEDTYVFPDPGITPPPPGFDHGEMHLVYHARSKGTDTFGPCGPWVVTRDEIADPNRLDVKVWMGDELCASDNTGKLRFPIEQVISWLTRFITLEPGDLVHMGTAARGKYGLRELDFQRWDGPCAIEIEGIGKLSNPIVRQDLDGHPVPKQPRQESAPWPPRLSSR